MKFIDKLITRLAGHLYRSIIGQWEEDWRVEITDKDRDYYNNYFLKGLEHPDYTTEG